MKRTVRVIVRDHPKRSNFFRSSVEVDAKTDDEALALGRLEAEKKWVGGKITVYDVDRILSHQRDEAAELVKSTEVPASDLAPPALNIQPPGSEIAKRVSITLAKPRQTLRAKSA